MKITSNLLKAKNAYSGQVDVFETEWPGGCEITLENCKRAVDLNLDLNWAAKHLLPAPAWQAYQEVEAPAWQAYQEVEVPAWQAYQEVEVPVWQAYQEVEVPAWQAYREVEASAWQAYQETKTAAFFNAVMMTEDDD